MLLKMLCLKKDGLHKHSPMPAWLASLFSSQPDALLLCVFIAQGVNAVT